MSFKVHSGFKFKASGFDDVHRTVTNFREEMVSVRWDAVSRWLAERAVRLLDEEAIAPGSHGGSYPLSAAYKELRDRNRESKATGYADFEVDFSFNIVIFPFESAFYGIAYSGQGSWLNSWFARSEIEAFGYSNASDRPASVKIDEWHERERVWSGIFKASSIPSMVGYEVRCVEDDVYLPDRDLILANVPSHETRVMKHARHLAADATSRRILDERDIDVAKACISDLVEIGTIVQKFLETEEGTVLVEEHASRIRPILVAEVSEDLLMSQIPLIDKEVSR